MIKIKKLDEPIDFYGKTWIVNTLSVDDLKIYAKENPEYKEIINNLTDSDMSWLARKLADALFDGGYWEYLNELLDILVEIKSGNGL